MSEIFISYARSTASKAQQIAEALRGQGYVVWHDDELPAHRDYSEVIEERLRAAKAVVVVWSTEAVKSQWVRAEADLAREAGTLVQLRLDEASLPMPFNRIQCADLANWAPGDADAPGWKIVTGSIGDLIRRDDRPTPPPKSLMAGDQAADWRNVIGSEPHLDPMRADPRFQAMMARADARLATSATPK
jgi:adenylate cyclase